MNDIRQQGRYHTFILPTIIINDTINIIINIGFGSEQVSVYKRILPTPSVFVNRDKLPISNVPLNVHLKKVLSLYNSSPKMRGTSFLLLISWIRAHFILLLKDRGPKKFITIAKIPSNLRYHNKIVRLTSTYTKAGLHILLHFTR